MNIGEGPEAACPTCPITGTSNGPWDGTFTNLGFSLTTTPTAYVLPLSSFAVDPIVDTMGGTAKNLVVACSGCPGAPGAVDFSQVATIGFGYQRRGSSASAGNMSARFTIDDIIFSEFEPNVTVSASTLSVDEVGVGSTQMFTVVLDAMPSHDVVVSIASDNVGEGTVSPASRTFTQANWDTPQSFTLNGVEDGVTDADQDYDLDITVTGDDLVYSALSVPSISATTVGNGVPVEVSGYGLE